LAKNSTSNRFLVCLLISSLLIISIAVIPLSSITSAADHSGTSSTDNADSHTSMSLIIQNGIDFRESETFFQYHFLQNMLSKRISEESGFPLLIVLNIFLLSIIFSLYADERYPLMIFMKISEFQHDKDGML